MTPADLAGADELRRLVGWNQTIPDWEHMLRLQPHGCFVAEAGTQIIGTVTTTCYSTALAWIGMMLVHPEHRRRGIGRALMLQALSHLKTTGVGCVRLDATPAGYPLYESLGFVPEWTLTRWERPAGDFGPSPSHHGSAARQMVESDWMQIVDLDRRSFGAIRRELLSSLAERASARLVWPNRGPVSGYGFLRPGSRCDYIGPLTCAEPAAAADLTAALLVCTEGRPVFWDIPDQNANATQMALSYAFTQARHLTRMRLGASPAEPDLRCVYGIADPAVG